ncbi:hypothetical protein RvY_14261 [Ramazzottius varieornatus]|uniref:Uncharacterized protein n=1 Tax=Ramazzottius varieornatus TaxID=947166 RepID=A0A1D1VUL1_RAMVA|nr:hypothetical protein RvY_14261 [Ramazzottius varieornatus]
MLALLIVLLALSSVKMSAAIPILVAFNVSTTTIPVDVVSSTVVPVDFSSSSTNLPARSMDLTATTGVMQIVLTSTNAPTSKEVPSSSPSNPDHVTSNAERTDVVVVVPAVKARELSQEGTGDIQTDVATMPRNDSVVAANSQPTVTGTAIVPAVQLPAGSIIINPPKDVQPVHQPTVVNGQPLPASSFPVNQPPPLTPKIAPTFVLAEPVQGPAVGIPTGTQQRFF